MLLVSSRVRETYQRRLSYALFLSVSSLILWRAPFAFTQVPALPFAGLHPGVASVRLVGPPCCVPVEPSADSTCMAACRAAADAPAPLQVVCELLEAGLLARAAEKRGALARSSSGSSATAVDVLSGGEPSALVSPGGGPLSTLPEHSVGVVIEDLASLLLAHPLSDVLECLLDVSRGLRGASPAWLLLELRRSFA